MVCVRMGVSSCRETAVKFNDYFEFPREFDMAPYTAATLAKTEGGELSSTVEAIVTCIREAHVLCTI